MIFIPVLVMNLILLVVTVLLAVADHFLITYGECKITVKQGDEKKEFTVKGGNYLLSSLNDNAVNISSSCGGKATCGYCKVRVSSGAGQILPTEEIFMSREEKLNNMRLACQVKVKDDIEISIPDFLTTVRSIVKNHTYDPRLRWNFKIIHQVDEIPEENKIIQKVNRKDEAKISEIIQRHGGKKGILLPVLQSVDVLYHYFPENILWYLSKELNIPLSLVFTTATFYNAFNLKPMGKHVINVCLGTACYVKGGPQIVGALERELGIKVGETTKDMNFSLETVRCLGCCGLSPVMTIGDDLHGKVMPRNIPKILQHYREK